ncbi:CbtB domain-containing protein [Methylopila musalis]|uniref:CbtB domain-containing protein n=1 Tax=Methylopila musalis TaxID=1134781 RepID=A0ABW3Z6K3_9HYPH
MSHADFRTSASSAALTSSRAVSIVAAFLFGVVIIGGVGFAQMAVAHNAAHDHRHSIGFPCH